MRPPRPALPHLARALPPAQQQGLHKHMTRTCWARASPASVGAGAGRGRGGAQKEREAAQIKTKRPRAKKKKERGRGGEARLPASPILLSPQQHARTHATRLHTRAGATLNASTHQGAAAAEPGWGAAAAAAAAAGPAVKRERDEAFVTPPSSPPPPSSSLSLSQNDPNPNILQLRQAARNDRVDGLHTQ